jgi:hypothetical protein
MATFMQIFGMLAFFFFTSAIKPVYLFVSAYLYNKSMRLLVQITNLKFFGPNDELQALQLIIAGYFGFVYVNS